MRPRGELKTLPEYDAIVMKEIKTPNVSGRPIESVVRTIEGRPLEWRVAWCDLAEKYYFAQMR